MYLLFMCIYPVCLYIYNYFFSNENEKLLTQSDAESSDIHVVLLQN